MQKIKSLYKRDYSGTRLVYDEVVEGSEWVLNGEGVATEKFDGTCCLVQDGKLYKRYDRKITKVSKKRHKKDPNHVWSIFDFKEAPINWIAAEDEPNIHTGHFPGWLPVDLISNDDKWHREGWGKLIESFFPDGSVISSLIPDGTYELVGEKVQGNPYGLIGHELWNHGIVTLMSGIRTFDGIKAYLNDKGIEGIVWHHPDGRMVKIKSSDFGIAWASSKT